MIPRWEDTPRCMNPRCNNAPLSAVEVRAVVTGPNERVADADICSICGAVGKIRMNLDAVKKFATSYEKISGLLRQCRVPSFTPEELRTGRIPGATARPEQEVKLREVAGYQPDKFIEAKQEALL